MRGIVAKLGPRPHCRRNPARQHQRYGLDSGSGCLDPNQPFRRCTPSLTSLWRMLARAIGAVGISKKSWRATGGEPVTGGRHPVAMPVRVSAGRMAAASSVGAMGGDDGPHHGGVNPGCDANRRAQDIGVGARVPAWSSWVMDRPRSPAAHGRHRRRAAGCLRSGACRCARRAPRSDQPAAA